MRIFLTGITGYVGSRVAERLKKQGHSVVGLVRSDADQQRLQAQGVEVIKGDLSHHSLLAEVAQASDGVIHTAFNHAGDFLKEVMLERQAIEVMVDALGQSGKPFIATNGTGVLGDTGAMPVDESVAVNSEFPASVRAEFETLLKDAVPNGVRTVVLRLPILLYGYGQSVLLPTLVETAKRTQVSYYIGEGTNRLSTTHVDDVADLFVLALEKAAAGSIYNVSGGDSVSGFELASAVCEAIGNSCRLESTSFEKAQEIWNPFAALLLSLNNQVSGQQAMTELNWKPRNIPTLLDDLKHGSYLQIDK
jgi:nucleoside-diphosphate-sugar epimerase